MSRKSMFLAFVCLVSGAAACGSSSSTPPRDGGSGGSSSGGSGGGTGGTTGTGGTSGSGGSGGGTGGSVDAGSGGSGGGSDASPVDVPAVADGGDAPAGDAGRTMMTFFITSTGTGPMGGNLGGIAGGDAKCQMLATAAGAGGRTWRAYLSATAEGAMPAVNARDRIGTGPWVNAMGTMIAANLDALHTPAMNMINLQNGRDERGMMVPTNEHDIMTGTTAMGMADTTTCMNWTSNAAGVSGRMGHFNRMGGGADPMSWNSAHPTVCTPGAIMNAAGAGRIYCFAIN